jgi:hypothetical protein
VLNVENNWVSKRKKQTVLKLRWYRSLGHAPTLCATATGVADNPFRVAVPDKSGKVMMVDFDDQHLASASEDGTVRRTQRHCRHQDWFCHCDAVH